MQGSPVCCRPRGHKGSDTTKRLNSNRSCAPSSRPPQPGGADRPSDGPTATRVSTPSLDSRPRAWHPERTPRGERRGARSRTCAATRQKGVRPPVSGGETVLRGQVSPAQPPGASRGAQGGPRGGCWPCQLKMEEGPRAWVQAPLEAGKAGNDSPQSLCTAVALPHLDGVQGASFQLGLPDPRTPRQRSVSHSAAVICYSGHKRHTPSWS